MWYWRGICAQIQRKQLSAFTLSLPPEHISVKFRRLNLRHIYFICKAAQIYFFVQWYILSLLEFSSASLIEFNISILIGGWLPEKKCQGNLRSLHVFVYENWCDKRCAWQIFVWDAWNSPQLTSGVFWSVFFFVLWVCPGNYFRRFISCYRIWSL